MQKHARFISYGLGPIGCRIARLALERGYEIAGAIDADENKLGRDAGEIIGTGNIGIVVSGVEALEKSADVALHSTCSRLDGVYPQLEGIIKSGKSVISTAEELSFPHGKNKELAERLDRLAKKHGVAALGTGVNPGFVMDSLVLMLANACEKIDEIKVSRIVDASSRRQPLQKKIGAGLSADDFRKSAEAGKIGHVGLHESAAMIAHGLGLELAGIKERIEPVIAEKSMRTEFIEIPKGAAAGLHQSASSADGKIILDLRMYVGAENPRDEITIKGSPDISVTINGGIAGDIATAAIVVNLIPKILKAQPGLHTMADMSVV